MGTEGEEPLLIISPEGFTIRLKPNESRKLILHSVPNYEWGNIEDLNIDFDSVLRDFVNRNSANCNLIMEYL